MPSPCASSLWLMSRLLPPIRMPNSDVCAIAGTVERSRNASANANFVMCLTIRDLLFVSRWPLAVSRQPTPHGERQTANDYNIARARGALHLGTRDGAN